MHENLDAENVKSIAKEAHSSLSQRTLALVHSLMGCAMNFLSLIPVWCPARQDCGIWGLLSVAVLLTPIGTRQHGKWWRVMGDEVQQHLGGLSFSGENICSCLGRNSVSTKLGVSAIVVCRTSL